ncbi:fructose-bisphosphatase class II, partial [Bacillus thuringiensis]|uniref:fructose-bisphosphatase class II n=1 Tax=Bacillus thuringiensis TaxID=1428 RepID=UPI0037C12BBB
MPDLFHTIPIKPTLLIPQPQIHQPPILYIPQKLGTPYPPPVHLPLHPLQPTNILPPPPSNPLPLIAIPHHPNFLHPPDIYIDKIPVRPEPLRAVDIHPPIIDN